MRFNIFDGEISTKSSFKKKKVKEDIHLGMGVETFYAQQMSEQIARDIDRQLMNDLLQGITQMNIQLTQTFKKLK